MFAISRKYLPVIKEIADRNYGIFGNNRHYSQIFQKYIVNFAIG